MSDTNSFSAARPRKECGDFAETTAFERYGVKTSEKANMHNEHWLISTRLSPFSAPWTNKVTKGICIQVQRCSKPTHDHAASLCVFVRCFF